jgi:hypothetical protein
MNFSSSPSTLILWLKMASASGDLQILPKQTNKTFTIFNNEAIKFKFNVRYKLKKNADEENKASKLIFKSAKLKQNKILRLNLKAP